MKLLQLFGLSSKTSKHSHQTDSNQEIETQYKSFLEDMEDGYYEIQLDGRFVYFNNYFSRLTGYRPKDLEKLSLYELLANDCRHRVESVFRKIHRTGLSINLMEWTIIRRDGARRTLEASITIRKPMTGEDAVMRGIVRDITDRKETEEALRLGNRAISATNNGIIITDPKNVHSIISCNPAFEKITGYTDDEVTGKPYTVLFGPDTDIKTADSIRQSLEQEREYRTIIKCYRKDENPFWNEMTFSPVRNSDGTLTHYIVMINDLTEHVQNEYKLRESEERFRKLLENASDVISVISEDGSILYESPAIERVLGYDNAKYRVGQNIFDFVHPEDRDKAVSTFLQFVNYPGEIKKFALRMHHADGTWRVMESVGHNLLDNPAIHGVILNSRDITGRITAEEALRKSEERYRLFFEDDLTGDYIATPEGKIISCNQAFAAMFGFSSVDDVLNTNLIDLYPTPDVHDEIIEQLNKFKKIEGHELELKHKNGKTVHIIENIVGIFDSSENLVEIKGYMFDNTERKRLEQQLIHVQKMQSLGTLAAGVAHDFNNVLSILDGSLSLVKPHVTDSAILKYISMGEMAVERGADVASRLLTFARTEDVKITPFDLHKTINELTKVLNHTIDKKIVVNADIDSELPFIKGDQGQVYQILLNLCLNARDAILDPRRNKSTQGKIHIYAVGVEREEVSKKFESANEAHYVRIRVKDNGIGMSDAVRQQIFDPFFTTKPAGKGTGLGLSVVYGMVKSHSGFIDVDSTEGKGSTLDIYLPALLIDQEFTKQLTEETVQGGSETILVVEDEEMMLTIVSEMLRINGYNVLQARDGKEGYDIFKKHHTKIGAVILDMGLPKISGNELFQKMKEIDPDVSVIVATGFNDTTLKSTLVQDGIHSYIQKPYKPKDILGLLRKVFDKIE